MGFSLPPQNNLLCSIAFQVAANPKQTRSKGAVNIEFDRSNLTEYAMCRSVRQSSSLLTSHSNSSPIIWALAALLNVS